MNFDSELQSKSLKANFDEVQQARFDKLMSELEQVSGGLGFAELKEKAEDGDREALQVMRDYIAKKEQIVEFIEKKEFPGGKFEEVELHPGDQAQIYRDSVWQKCEIIRKDSDVVDIIHIKLEGEKEGFSLPVNKDQLFKTSGNEINVENVGFVEVFERNKYYGLWVGQKLKFLDQSMAKEFCPELPWHIEAIDVKDVEIERFAVPRGDQIQKSGFEILVKIMFNVGQGLPFAKMIMVNTDKVAEYFEVLEKDNE